MWEYKAGRRVIGAHALKRLHASTLPTLSRTLRRAFLWATVCVTFAGGCENDLRVPYIPPTLANWPQPYRGVAGLKVHVFNTGYLRVPEALVLRGGSLTRKRDLAVPAVLIEHPQQGLVLFNTGLNPKPKDTSPAPEWLNAFLGAEVLPGKDVTTQLRDAGFNPQAVRWIVLSNLRSDHTGEVESFPQARVVVTKVEREYAQRGSRGYDPSSFGDVANWKFIDFASTTGVATFPVHVDLFGDGSCLLLDASGSTPGALALLVRLREQPLMLADGFASVDDQVRYAAQPAAAADLHQWWEHIWRLKRFKDLVPDLIVLPGHDLSSIGTLHSRDIVVHPFAPPRADTSATPTAGMLDRIMPRPMSRVSIFVAWSRGTARCAPTPGPCGMLRTRCRWPAYQESRSRAGALWLLVLHAGAPTRSFTGGRLVAGFGSLCTRAATAATAVRHAATGCPDRLVGVGCRCGWLRCLGLLRLILGAAHAHLNRTNQGNDARNDECSFHKSSNTTNARTVPPSLHHYK